MLNFLYHLCIAPLQSFMGGVLSASYALTDSYGFALILLSVAVTIALIPFYHLAEIWQREERAIQRAMEPKLHEIKTAFAGKERYMYVQTLYRQHGYSPLFALKASAGLLLQIPFFIAAYQLVSTTPALQGVAFGIIADLGKPDALLALGGLHLNLLPLVMTGANLFSAHVYTAGLTHKERRQLYILAALFLVLLYNAPSALLIYWTCNNIFSIVKNYVYQLWIYAEPQSVLASTEVVMTSPCESGAVPSYMTWVHLFLFIAGAICFAIAATIERKQGANILALVLVSAAAVSTMLALVMSCWTLAKSRVMHETNAGDTSVASGKSDNIWLLAIFFACLVGISTGALTSHKKLASPASWYFFRLFAGSIGCMAGYALTQWPLLPLLRKGQHACAASLSFAQARSLCLTGLFCSAVLLFIYTPAHLYASDPDFYYDTLAELSAGCVWLGILFIALFFGCFSILKSPVRPLYAAGMGFFAVVFLLFAFVATADYGTMDNFLLQNEGILKTRWAPFIDCAVFAASGGLLWWLIKTHRLPLLSRGLQGITFALLLMAGFALGTAPSVAVVDLAVASTRLPEYNDRLFGLSPSGTNVVVIMLDMFTGSHVRPILEQAPELREGLSGFIWYPDTMAPGATTLLSIAALTGGEEFAPMAINGRQEESLVAAMQQGFSVIPRTFVPQGYDVAMADIEQLQPQLLESMCPEAKKMLVVGKSFSTAYTGYWRQAHGLPSPLPESQVPFLGAVGLFQAAPWVLRNHIYFSGSWLGTQTINHNPSEGPWAMLDSLPQLTRVSEAANTLKFITSQAVHYPWRLDATTCMPVATNNQTRKGRVIIEHETTERCALLAISRWAEWLQANDLYDNTLIILASDHDGNDSLVFDDAFNDLRKSKIPWKPDALLMVKPLGKRGPLEVRDDLMSSADILAIICSQTKNCGDIPTIEKVSTTQRVRTHSSGLASIRRHEKNKFTVTNYQVNGTMFERKNWKELP